MKLIFKYALPVLIILSLVSRLPQLLSSNLFLDGDECIVGLMAKHFAEGKELPFFFYGQSYGFSFVEVLSIRVFYAAFGVTDIAIKLAMFFLWTLGIVFFYKTLQQIDFKSNKWAPFLITLLFIFSPAWAIWSLKARGGYITAFLFSSVITYLVFNKKWKSSLAAYFILGLFTVIVYQSQPLWLAGLLPILAYHLYKNKSIKTAIGLLGGALTAMLAFFFIKLNISHYWSPQVLNTKFITLESIASVPNQVYKNLLGSYTYSIIDEPIFVTKLLAVLFSAGIYLVLIWAVISVFKKKKISAWFYVLCVSVLGTMSYVVLTNGIEPRYLLPLSGFALLLFYLFVIQFQNTKIINSVLVVFIVLGAISMYSFKNYFYESKSELLSLIDELESEKVEYMYCKGGLLQWQIMFYSNEHIIGRYTPNTDRYPEYVERVSNAVSTPNSKIALVGYYVQIDWPAPEGFTPVDKDFFYFLNPPDSLLLEHSFVPYHQ